MCRWRFIDNETNHWETGCGKSHWMGRHCTPIEMGFKVCPYCSERLAQSTAGYIPFYDHYRGSHNIKNTAHLVKLGYIKL